MSASGGGLSWVLHQSRAQGLELLTAGGRVAGKAVRETCHLLCFGSGSQACRIYWVLPIEGPSKVHPGARERSDKQPLGGREARPPNTTHTLHQPGPREEVDREVWG